MQSLDFALREKTINQCLPLPTDVVNIVCSYNEIELCVSEEWDYKTDEWDYKTNESILGVIGNDVYAMCGEDHKILCNHSLIQIKPRSFPLRVMKVNERWRVLISTQHCTFFDRRCSKVFSIDKVKIVTVHDGKVYFVNSHTNVLCAYNPDKKKMIPFPMIRDVIRMKRLGNHLMLTYHEGVQLLGESFDVQNAPAMYKWNNHCFLIQYNELYDATADKRYPFDRGMVEVRAFEHLLCIRCTLYEHIVWDLNIMQRTDLYFPHVLQPADNNRLYYQEKQKIFIYS